MTDNMTPENRALCVKLRGIDTYGYQSQQAVQAATAIASLSDQLAEARAPKPSITLDPMLKGITVEDALERMTAEIAAKDARVAELEAALREAAVIFRSYEQMHLAKGTQDGVEKAYRNHEAAMKCEITLENRNG